MGEASDKVSIDAEELSALRSLLFQQELERIAWLESQVARYPTTEAVARALPEAVRMSAERSGRLKEALTQPVESALQKSVAENPQPLVDVLFPILGPMIRKAVRSALEGMLQGLNQAADHSLNPAFRFQAWRSGVPFAEYVVLRTLVYRVEQFFLLEREASLLLRHASRDPESQDPDMVAGMLSALGQATRQFAVDSFKVQETESLEVFQIGELQVHMLVGRQAILAAVVRGTLPQEFKVTLAEFLESVEFRYSYQLDNFRGDSTPFEPLTPELQQLLAQECLPPSTRPSKGALAILGLAALACLLLVGFHGLTEYQWSLFVKNLERKPGILVTRTETPWRARLGFPPLYRERQVYGIKDHLAEEPVAAVEDLGLLQPKVTFFWEPYQSDHPLILRRRVMSLLQPPKTAQVSLDDKGTLKVKGFASADWISRAQLQAIMLPGIEAYDDSELQDIEPINRIRKKLAPPNSVELILSDGVLLAVGKAPHAWLVSSRKASQGIPEVQTFDSTGVIDLDLERYQLLVKSIGARSIYFTAGTSNPIGNVESTVEETARDWAKISREAKTLDKTPRLQVTGQSDKLGTKAQNAKLSLERAAKIRTMLNSQGVRSEEMTLEAVQSPNEDPRLRRVIFFVSD